MWWLGGVLFIIANLAFGASIVFYNAYLPDIASLPLVTAYLGEHIDHRLDPDRD